MTVIKLKLEEFAYEYIFMALAQLIILYLVFTIANCILGQGIIIQINSLNELILSLTAIYIAPFIAEIIEYALIKIAGGNPGLGIYVVHGIPLLRAFDKKKTRYNKDQLRLIKLTPTLIALILSLFVISLKEIDMPILLLALAMIAYRAGDVFLYLITQICGKKYRVLLIKEGLIITGKINYNQKLSIFLKEWARWFVFIFLVETSIFSTVLAGAIAFEQSFTFNMGPINVFAVERTMEGVYYRFNIMNNLAIALLVALIPARFSYKVALS